MREVLVSKFDATPEYAAWWAAETVGRYRASGTPEAPARRPKAVAVYAAEYVPKSKKRAASPDVAEPVTIASMLALVDRAKGDFSKANGVITVTFNGNRVFHGRTDTPEEVQFMYATVEGYTSVAAGAKVLFSKFQAVQDSLHDFVKANGAALAVMGAEVPASEARLAAAERYVAALEIENASLRAAAQHGVDASEEEAVASDDTAVGAEGAIEQPVVLALRNGEEEDQDEDASDPNALMVV